MESVLQGRVIRAGRAEGPALVSPAAIGFLGGVDPDSGVVLDPGHPLQGQSIAGKILVFPHGKGSTVGSYTILRLAREREELRVVADQRGCPTYAGDIADVLLELAGRIGQIDADNAWGVYHYCGEPATTWHGFASAIVERARLDEKLKLRTVTPITTADYPTPAARPANSVLDCARLTARFGIHPASWREGLATLLFALHGR